jgi:uncharacterized protein
VTERARRLQPIAAELLGGFRALVINGPRQAGKSTLLRQIQSERPAPVVNLDDASLRQLAVADPTTFVRQLMSGTAIDEFQRGGDPLLLAIKERLDADSRRGQFVLAGSTQFLAMRSISESLTGRIGIVELLPFSVGELQEHHESFIDQIFTADFVSRAAQVESAPVDRRDYAELIACGGFPEVALGPVGQRFRTRWCEAYLRTVTAVANVDQVANVRRPEALFALLGQLAARTGGELVPTDLARDVLIDPATVTTYCDALSTLYLLRPLPAWTTSMTTRAKRRSVIHLVDTALAAHLVGVGPVDLSDLSSRWFGPLLESFVVNEISKQATWSDRPVRLGHFRDRDQREVDLIVERGREVVGVEVKATGTPSVQHARHLIHLRDRLGERFRHGIVLHTGRQRLMLGDRIVALPVSALWSSPY